MTKKFDIIFESLLTVYGESMTFAVADADNVPEDIGTAGFHIAWGKDLTAFLHNNLSPEEIATWQENRPPDWLIPDGDSYFEQNGILNLYTKGLPEKVVTKLVGAIKYYLGELGAKVTGEVKKEKSKMFDSEVYRIPVSLTPTSENAPEMNLSNRNAEYFLTQVLGYHQATLEAGSYNAKEMLMKLEQIEDEQEKLDNAVVPSKQQGNNYEGGISSEQIQRYILKLKEICEWAITNGHTYISVN